jgi:SAM-dependent methyltransferase
MEVKRALGLAKAMVYPPRGSMTRYFLKRYCRGKGLEVGPGKAPYSLRRETVYLDRFKVHAGRPARADVLADAGHVPFRDSSFDHLISSHCLEHCADTLAVLSDWVRVVRPGGILFLILPHGERTFDRGRPLTPLEHHIEDRERAVGPLDPAPWAEFERFSIPQHRHAWLAEARKPDGSWDFEWIVRHGHLHYHVWTQHEMAAILAHVNCRLLVALEELPERPDSFLCVARVEKTAGRNGTI